MRDPEFFDDRDFVLEDEDDSAIAPRRDLWQVLSQLMIVCLFVLVLAGILRIFWPEIQRHRQLSAEVERLEVIRDKRLERVAELKRRNEWMLTDPDYLESVARDRLDLAHEHEVVVRIDRDSEARAIQIEKERLRQKRMEEELAAAASAAAAGLEEGAGPAIAAGAQAAEAGVLADSTVDENAAKAAAAAAAVDEDVSSEINTDLPSPRARVVELKPVPAAAGSE